MLKKISKDTLLSLIIYLFSVGLFTITDFLVIHYCNTEEVANWAFYKSLVFIFGGMCVLGFDQILLRDISKYEEIKKQFIYQSLIISLIVSLFIIGKVETYIDFLKIIIILFFYSCFLFYSGYWRASKNLVNSQIYTNSWKIFIFFIFLVNIYFLKFKIIDLFFFAISISFIILFIFGFRRKINLKMTAEIKNEVIKDKKIQLFFLGLYFFIHSFSLVIANYGEQFLINYFGNDLVSKDIFSYITFYSAIVLAGIGFIGFYLGPQVRYDRNFDLKKYYLFLKKILLVGAFLIFFNSVAVYILNLYFFKEDLNDIGLWLLVVTLTVLRVLYVIPSLCLGIFGSVNKLKKTSMYSLLFAAIYVIVFSMLMYFDFYNLKYLIIILMILHWASKIYISHYYVKLSLNQGSLK